MAKETGARKGSKGVRKGSGGRNAKKAARKARGHATSPTVALPGPEREAEADNSSLREGADNAQLLTQVRERFLSFIDNYNTAEETRNRRLEVMERKLRDTAEGITDVYEKLDSLSKPVAPEEIEQLARTLAAKAERDGKRGMLWLMEKQKSQQQDRNKPPRPSIIGRALFDLQTKNPEQLRTPVAVFTQIREHGPHHLSPAILKALDRYRRTDGKVDKDASGKLGKHLDTRLDELRAAEHVTHTADQRTLTNTGLRLFDQWPEWDTRHDDVQCCGYARNSVGQGRPQEEGGAARTAGTAGTDADADAAGGVARGQSE